MFNAIMVGRTIKPSGGFQRNVGIVALNSFLATLLVDTSKKLPNVNVFRSLSQLAEECSNPRLRISDFVLMADYMTKGELATSISGLQRSFAVSNIWLLENKTKFTLSGITPMTAPFIDLRVELSDFSVVTLIDELSAASEVPSIQSLTSKQFEIVQLVAKGYSNQEIAEQIGCSRRAVELILNRVMTRMGLEPASGRMRDIQLARLFNS